MQPVFQQTTYRYSTCLLGRRVKLSPTSLALYCIAVHPTKETGLLVLSSLHRHQYFISNHARAWSTLGELLNIPTHFYEHIIEFIRNIIFIGLSLKLFHLTLNEQVRQLLFYSFFYSNSIGASLTISLQILLSLLSLRFHQVPFYKLHYDSSTKGSPSGIDFTISQLQV